MSNTKGTSVISSPKGGGAQGGLGEKFSPDLFTGTGNFSVPIALPAGRNGFQPELSLGYSSGNGNGCFGLGWAMGVPGVMRKTSKGIPIYNDQSDIFILSGAEDLVPVKEEYEAIPSPNGNIAWNRTYYQPRTEGLFARIIHHKKSSGEDYWEVKSKDGLVSYYGASTGSATVINSATVNTVSPSVSHSTIANPENRSAIFSWALTKTIDVFGNEIVYEYDRELVIDTDGRSYDQIYLSRIRYADYADSTQPNGKNYMCEVRLIYEQRPDPFSSYKQGFEVRTTKRCIKLETYTNAATLIKTKTYQFTYEKNESELPLNGMSILTSVKVVGHKDSPHTSTSSVGGGSTSSVGGGSTSSVGGGDEGESMPPLQFSYSDFTPQKRELKTVKGPIPAQSIGEAGFELIDITGNGLPDLLQLNGIARYWTNKGNGEFSPPRELNVSPSVQLGQAGVQVIDANGDGRSDLLVHNGLTAGYFPGAFKSVWDNKGFRPFKQIPSFSFNDPEVQLMDLDGDGITDVLRNGQQFECFYNHPDKGFYKTRLAPKTFTNFSFADPRIRFADMTGDGLQDIVLISSGLVQYWPNMGYGRFGEKQNMKNAPVFPEQYNPSQILIGDMDGDGQSDIVFVENNQVTLYINQSGNGFSKGICIKGTPGLQNPKGIRIADIMGTGQASLVWSYSAFSEAAVGAASAKMYVLDFTRGNKPYVLEQMNNNMGSITRVKYGSSVYHYLRDEVNPATRWQTELPFAVQVVNRVEVLDLLSGGKLVTEYKYHHGYWDGAEREFRGFAAVESTDTESFDAFNTQALFDGSDYFTSSLENTHAISNAVITTVASEHYSPPVQTKSWFYLGAVGDGFERWQEPDFSSEYWNGDANVLSRSATMNNTLANLPRRARRDALRTLRGSLLRSELYALDNSSLQNKPYTVTESVMELRVEHVPSSPSTPSTGSGDEGYIFFPYNVAQRTTQYERGTDPMHNFSFTKNYDAYGQALAQLSMALPRGCNISGGGNGTYLGTYSETVFIYKDTLTHYMVNRVMKSVGYDASASAVGKSVFEWRDDVFTNVSSLPVLSCVLNYYDGLAFTGLALGQIGNYGAQVRSESLISTDALVSTIYGASVPPCYTTVPNWSAYPTDFVSAFQNADAHLGYKDRRVGYPDHIAGWYAESARVKYDFQTGQTTAKGLVIESKDVYEVKSDISYDVYQLLPVSSRQWLNATDYLETVAVYDYRVMQPSQITDANGNSSVFDFSPLGLLQATAVIGKGTEGDYKAATGDFYDKYEPSVRMEYDFFAFVNAAQPVWVKTISREQHYQQQALSDTIVKVEYSDGFGRLLQTRVQAEDVIFKGTEIAYPSTTSTSSVSSVSRYVSLGDVGLSPNQSFPNAPAVGTLRGLNDPLHVVVSGWQVYNNKGKVVEQYEPFFDSGFEYQLPSTLGVKARLFYDSLGRVVKTLNPDNSEQRVIYGVLNNLTNPDVFAPSPWENYTYDANDLASISGILGTGNVAPSHHFTPKCAVIDALGRTIKTIECIDNSSVNALANVVMHYQYDIRGNLVRVIDPLGRAVFEHKYDLRTPAKDEALTPLWTKHIDKGISTVVLDAVGRPMESSDAKGAWALSGYDQTGRPKQAWARDNMGDSMRLRSFIKYRGVTSADKTNNMSAAAFMSYDESGCSEIVNKDFKGSVLRKKQYVLDYTLLKTALQANQLYKVDWTGLPNILDAQVFETSSKYDALGRATELKLPKDVNGLRKKILPTYNRAGGLEKVTYDGTTFVENMVYDAKGQRMLVAFGNGIMTRYAYDSLSFQLKRQKSEKYAKTVVGNTITYTPQSGSTKQDDGFDFDLVGNIMKILHRVNDCGISGSILGSNALDRNFSYDALNRLLTADGRESDTNTGNSYIYNEAPMPSSPNANHVRSYNRIYSYDKLGNVQRLVQSGMNGFTRDFVYNANVNTLNKIQDANAIAIEDYTYDANGNQLTAGSTRNYVWNHSDQLIGFTSTNVLAQYDYSGQNRVSKLVKNGNTFERTIYLDGIFEYHKLETLSATYEKNYIHIMDDTSRIAEVRVGVPFPLDIADDIIYNLETEIGSSCVRLDANGTVIDREEYYPFGDSSLRTFTYKRYRYVGKEKDAESGLYYYGARYYAAWTCRFISVDPLALKYAQITPYNYADNNPINDFDIDGMQTAQTQGNPPAVTTGSGGSVPQGGGTPNIQINTSGSNYTAPLSAVSSGASGSNISPASAAKHAQATKLGIKYQMQSNALRAGGVLPQEKVEKGPSVSDRADSNIFGGALGLVFALVGAATGVGALLSVFSMLYSADMLGAGVTQKLTNIETQPLFQQGTTAFGRDILGMDEEAAAVFGNVTYGGLGLLATGGFRSPNMGNAGSNVMQNGIGFGNAAKGVNVAAENMIFSAAEKEALMAATGYSRTRIINGTAVIDQFGMYKGISHNQVNLIKQALQNNGATSIKIFTNAVNVEMKSLITQRMNSGKGIFGLTITKRILPGYILKGGL